MKKRMSGILRKCRSLSRLGRSSSYSSLGSKSHREEEEEQRQWEDVKEAAASGDEAVVFVGSSRRRYRISSKHLSHPLIGALIDRSEHSAGGGVSVRCEVVLFDHLLWLLESADPEEVSAEGSLEELAQLYVAY